MNIAIIGLGLIGSSIALDLNKRGFTSKITGVDIDDTNSSKALGLGIIHKISNTENALADNDLIILAVPVNNIVSLLPYILNNIKTSAVVTDVGSTKNDICRAVESHPNRSRYVASHPMAGTENSSPEAALKDLFNDKICIICDKDKSSPNALRIVEKMYKILGMQLVEIESEDHDIHAAFVSHLSHITSFALANAVLEKELDRRNIFNLAGGGFESTARLAKSSPEMWAQIFQQNRKNICEALDLYIKHIKLFKNSIADNDIKIFKNLMTNANLIRRVLIKINNK